MMFSRHELHIVLSDEDDQSSTSQYSVTDITDGTAVEEIVKSVVPEGIRVKIPERKIQKSEDSGYELKIFLYKIYSVDKR